MNKKSLRKIIVLFAAVIVSCANLFAQTSLPTGYGKIKIGMSVDEVKKILQSEKKFGFRGDRDVSMMPRTEQVLIETDASEVDGSFFERCWFQFNDDKLYIITLNLNTKKIDHYSVFDSLCKKYGNPQKLDPEKSMWQNNTVIFSLEKPLVLRYTDRVVFNKLMEESNIEKSNDEYSRDNFLNSL